MDVGPKLGGSIPMRYGQAPSAPSAWHNNRLMSFVRFRGDLRTGLCHAAAGDSGCAPTSGCIYLASSMSGPGRARSTGGNRKHRRLPRIHSIPKPTSR